MFYTPEVLALKVKNGFGVLIRRERPKWGVQIVQNVCTYVSLSKCEVITSFNYRHLYLLLKARVKQVLMFLFNKE